MNVKPDVKLFISCHKACALPSSPVFVPVQAGAALSEYRLDMQKDNEGEHISDKNRRYCELTTQYWAWKNVAADYYGFCHYRRFFSFSDLRLEQNQYGFKYYDFLGKNAEQELCLEESAVQKQIQKADLIVAASPDLLYMGAHDLYEHYDNAVGLNLDDLKLAVSILKEKYPEYSKTADQYMTGHLFYPCNMFIMKRELFFEYSSWLFDILDETDRRIDYSNYSAEGLRTIGHIAERLLGIFFSYKKEAGVKTGVLQWGYIRNTDPFPSLSPAFSSNNIPIVMCCNNSFLPYNAVAIQSIISHASDQYNYDIILMHKDITERNQQLLCRMVQQYSNFSMRFLNVTPIFDDIELNSNNHISIESFYRLELPQILNQYQKVLYLDGDLIILKDVACLYQTDISGFLLAATRDADHAGLYGGATAVPGVKQYTDEVLQLQDPYQYFQAGVILFNLDQFRQTFAPKELILTAQTGKYHMFLDQDILNAKCHGHVLLLPMNWNIMTDHHSYRIRGVIQKAAPFWIFEEYMAGRADPYIVHFAGREKPWNTPDCDFAPVFWKYARMTPFYEVILSRLSDNCLSETRERLEKLEYSNRSVPRKVADLLLPKGSSRRERVKRLLHR